VQRFRSRDVTEDQKCALTVAMVCSCCATNLIGIGRRGEILGSVLTRIKVTKHFLIWVGTCSYRSRLELLPSVVWTSQSTRAQRMFAHFVGRNPSAKTQSVTLIHFFCGTNSHNRRAEDHPGVGFFQKNIYPLRLL